MALLLSEAAKLSTDVLQRGVIETIIKESPILQMLPFMTIEGNSYKYTQENTLGSADFYGVNAVWSRVGSNLHPAGCEPGDPGRGCGRGQLHPENAE